MLKTSRVRVSIKTVRVSVETVRFSVKTIRGRLGLGCTFSAV